MRRKRTDSHASSERGRRRRRSGSVVIAVLAVIMILGFLVTRFMHEAAEDLKYRAIFTGEEDYRAFAYSLLEASLAAISEVAEIDEGKLYAPEQGWSDPLAYADIPIPNGWEASVRVQDENNLLPLNFLEENTLVRLFEEMDFDFSTSRELASALLDWIDEDNSARLNGAESDDYLLNDPPYRAANGPIQSLDEFRLIEGFAEYFFDEETGLPTEEFRTFAGAVSLVNDGPVNINSAPPFVLKVLGVMGGFDEERIFDGLFDEPYLKEVPESADSGLTTTTVDLLSIIVTLKRGDVPFSIYALVRPNFGDGGSRGAGNVGRSSDEDVKRTGSEEEQAALNYPFTIIRLSEHRGSLEIVEPARYSAVDIPGQNGDE